MGPWLLVDDSAEEGASFVTYLARGNALSINHMTAHDAALALGNGALAPAGVLMDVDLSNEPGQQLTGPGLSQDIRVAQQKQTIPPFPIVRFSFRARVIENIGRDPSSDDIFDLKIEKDGIGTEEQSTAVQSKLIGIRQIYDALEVDGANLPKLLGISDDLWSQWGSSAFQSDFELGDRTHLKASPLVRMMTHPGLLIDEEILAFRLGIDRAASKGWPNLREKLADYIYRGVSSDYFVRWWARAIEDFWQDRLEAHVPLAGSTIGQRIEHLSQLFGELVPLTMPKGSMGERPWRYCLLTKEQRQEVVPVDPARSVRIKPRSPMPSWLDPLYATLGAALQNRDDPRVDKDDLKRLEPFARNH